MHLGHKMRLLVRHLELVLTAAGVLVVFTAHLIWDSPRDGSWVVAAGTAIAVGVIHGVIFWLVRRRQRQIRARALTEARHMLRDIVNNRLCVIQFLSDMRDMDKSRQELAQAQIRESVRQISEVLENISEESLSLWKRKYPQSVPSEEPR